MTRAHLAKAWSIALLGIDGVPVEIEAAIGGGRPEVQIVGLPDAALKQAKERIRAAIVNSGENWPDRKMTFALSPAALPKTGAGYDLALACAAIGAASGLPQERLTSTVLLGELALDGRLRTVRGVLPALLAARQAQFRRAVVPLAALAEATVVPDLAVFGAESLSEVLQWIRKNIELPCAPSEIPAEAPSPCLDLADVVGQPEARWALEVAAAGGHHMLLIGPPGVGKTMLAERLIGLLPPLTVPEAIEVSAIHSVAGLFDPTVHLITRPPFIAPHSSTSIVGLIGGGSGLAKPGAISTAHRGVLFMDEAGELGPQRLESLRTALEQGEIRLARRDGIVCYPARFQLLLATNPCPCAPARDVDCVCSPAARRRYTARFSGPLMDRIDLQVRLRPLLSMTAPEDCAPESSALVSARVHAARQRSMHRWAEHGWLTNAEVPGPVLHREFRLPAKTTEIMNKALTHGMLSGRGADRCLRVAWTLADLAECERPEADHVAAALHFRNRGIS